MSSSGVRQSARETTAETSQRPTSARSFPWPILLTDEQAAAALNVSVRRLHELREQPWFPKAIALGPRQLRFARAELEAAVASMPRQEGKSEPSQLAAARRRRIEAMKAGKT